MTDEALIEKIQAKWDLVNRNRQLRSLNGDYTGQEFINGECSAFQEAIAVIRQHKPRPPTSSADLDMRDRLLHK
jgi:hypothetical protein